MLQTYPFALSLSKGFLQEAPLSDKQDKKKGGIAPAFLYSFVNGSFKYRNTARTRAVPDAYGPD